MFQISELSSEQWEKFVESWRKQLADVIHFNFISIMILMCYLLWANQHSYVVKSYFIQTEPGSRHKTVPMSHISVPFPCVGGGSTRLFSIITNTKCRNVQTHAHICRCWQGCLWTMWRRCSCRNCWLSVSGSTRRLLSRYHQQTLVFKLYSFPVSIQF